MMVNNWNDGAITAKEYVPVGLYGQKGRARVSASSRGEYVNWNSSPTGAPMFFVPVRFRDLWRLPAETPESATGLKHGPSQSPTDHHTYANFLLDG